MSDGSYADLQAGCKEIQTVEKRKGTPGNVVLEPSSVHQETENLKERLAAK